MAFIYTVYQRKNKSPLAKTEFSAIATSKQIKRVTTKELAEDIADRCTVHRADVVAVLDALSVSATSFLLNGFGVELGELGSLSMRINCKAAPTLEEFKPELIKGAKIRFTPSTEIKTRIKGNNFINFATLSAKEAGKAETPVTPGAGSGSGGGAPEGVI